VTNAHIGHCGKCGEVLALDDVKCDKGPAWRNITYYQMSSARRPCDSIMPRRLDLSNPPSTRAILAFAVFDNKTFTVDMADPKDEQSYKDFLDLRYEDVSRGIAIGGWGFSDEGSPTHTGTKYM
jgi:hypothetical protein